MRTIILGVLFGVLVSCSPARAAEESAAPDFADPAAVFGVFVERVAAADSAGALALFAHGERARRYDFVAMSRSLLLPLFGTQELGIHDAYYALDEALMAAKSAEAVSVLIRNLLLPEKFADLQTGRPIAAEQDGEPAGEILAALDPGRLSELSLVALDEAEAPSEDEHPRYLEFLAEQRAAHGYDEIRNYKVLYRLGTAHYVGGVAMVRYRDRWLIDDLRSSAAVLAAGFLAVPIKPEEYAAFTAQ